MNSKHQVLVVDDDSAVLDMLELALSQYEFDVTKANSGVIALEAAKKRPFDVVITDLKMPGMSGQETLRSLKQINPSLPVIIISGFASNGTQLDCSKIGAFGFLPKPFKLEQLISVVAQAIQANSHQPKSPSNPLD